MLATFLRSCLIVLCAVALTACKDKKKEARRVELRELMHGNANDPDIKAATEKARATLPDFLAALQKPAANQRQFMVRKSFPAKDGKQQILWVTDVTYDGTLLHGKIDDNTAQPGTGAPPDGKVSFPPAEIADWMFNDDGKAAGGYMLRALKNKMTEEEWAGITREIQFKD
jgi:uncharacterized protein YegJ (DUF2314 family)